MAKHKPGAFSVRYGLRPRPAGLLYDTVPDTARLGFLHLLQDCRYYLQWRPLYKQITRALRLERWSDACDNHEAARGEVESTIRTCDWWGFYDVCEIMVDAVREASGSGEFQQDVNRLFEDESLGWRLKDGLVERVGTEQSERLLDEARHFLEDARFAAPEEQFAKAVRALSVRPEPDTANCVKDAVGAVEGVARILTGRPSAVLSGIVADLRRKKTLHPALAKCFDGLYGYRGDAEGAAHGAVTDVAVPLPEAEMALNTSAALIIYLVNKAAEVGLSS
jgi:hypothetical protein